LARFGSVLARFGSVFSRLARFSRFGSVFSVWLGFFPVFFRFGSVFPVPGLKNQNRTKPVGFFKILIGLRFGFFGYFFFGFLGLIGFSVFLNTPSLNQFEPRINIKISFDLTLMQLLDPAPQALFVSTLTPSHSLYIFFLSIFTCFSHQLRNQCQK